MKEQLISFETAKLAKEKGFDTNVSRNTYSKQGAIQHNTGITNRFIDDEKNTHFNMECVAPTQSLLQKWLREEKDIFVTIDFEPNIETESAVNDTYTFKIIKQNNNLSFDKIKGYGIMYDSYEEALEIGLQEALKLIQ